MLIDFKVRNYRSLRDPVTLSAVEVRRGPGRARQGSGKRRGVKTDTEIAAAFRLPGRNFALLPVLGVFGPNNSGKTNLLRALDDLLFLMTCRVPLAAHVEPFKLDRDWSSSPTHFQLRLAFGEAIYSYSLKVDQRQVCEETLEYSRTGTGETTPIYRRRQEQGATTSTWELGDTLASICGKAPADIGAHHTFMVMLADYEAHPLLSPLAAWLKKSIRGISRGYNDVEREIATYWAREQQLSREAFLQFLRSFDLSIANLEVRREWRDAHFVDQVIVHRDTPEGRIAWTLEHESSGTQRLFEMAPKVLWTLHQGKLALFDELGGNFHPYITERIVRLFQNPETNPRQAQLIFTSHDNTLLQNQLLRRDQVLFTEMRADGSTDLYSASDFRARNDLALDKAYLDGRFGAVPVIRAETGLASFEGLPE